jgi:predicted AAA+ superfamily ATPase
VADELAAHGIKLFYWKGKTSSELEFIIEHNGEIIPVDAKKNKGSLSSLNKYRENNAYGISVKISQNHYGYSEQNHLLTIPYYYVSFWLDELTESSEQQS